MADMIDAVIAMWEDEIKVADPTSAHAMRGNPAERMKGILRYRKRTDELAAAGVEALKASQKLFDEITARGMFQKNSDVAETREKALLAVQRLRAAAEAAPRGGLGTAL